MKIKSVALAVAASMVASQAFALNPTDSQNATLKLNVSGATAADIQFANYVAAVCQAGTLDEFRNTDDSARAFSCNVAAGQIPGVSGGTSALFRKASGGSIQGVGPVADAATVPGINLSTCSTTATPNEWDCSNTTINVPAELGISDVEPELFTISANGGLVVSGAGLAALTVNSVNVQTFGVVVTPDLRDALQGAQGLTVGSDDVSQMPSLSSALIANIFAGRMANWSTLVDGSGVGINATTPAVASDRVEICVRAPGSGTQAQFNAFYLGNACAYRGATAGKQYLGFGFLPDGAGVVNDIARRQLGPILAPPPHNHHQTGSSDLGKCLTNLAADGRTGIGVQSLEKVVEDRTDRNNFKYVAVDGVTPTLENVQNGLYRNWAALSIQWRGDVVTGTKLAAAEKFVELAQAVGPVADFNNSLQTDPAGVPMIFDATNVSGRANLGSLAFAGKSGNPSISGAFDPAAPLYGFDKAETLGNPSSCAVSRLLSGQKIDVSYQN